MKQKSNTIALGFVRARRRKDGSTMLPISFVNSELVDALHDANGRNLRGYVNINKSKVVDALENEDGDTVVGTITLDTFVPDGSKAKSKPKKPAVAEDDGMPF